MPEDDVADALERLVDANLLESPAADWYRFHDLLRVYATERAQAEDRGRAGRGGAGYCGGTWTRRGRRQHGAPQPLPDDREKARKVPAAGLLTRTRRLAWYDDERANVVAATRQAAAAGLHDVAWRLPPTLFPLFNRRGDWADCVTTHRLAWTARASSRDRLGEAWALNQLGSPGPVRDTEASAISSRRSRSGGARRPGARRSPRSVGGGVPQEGGAGRVAPVVLAAAADLLRPTGMPFAAGSSR